MEPEQPSIGLCWWKILMIPVLTSTYPIFYAKSTYVWVYYDIILCLDVIVEPEQPSIGLCGWLLTGLSLALVLVTIPFSLFVCFKVHFYVCDRSYSITRTFLFNTSSVHKRFLLWARLKKKHFWKKGYFTKVLLVLSNIKGSVDNPCNPSLRAYNLKV